MDTSMDTSTDDELLEIESFVSSSASPTSGLDA
jgi:hypothetical protein